MFLDSSELILSTYLSLKKLAFFHLLVLKSVFIEIFSIFFQRLDFSFDFLTSKSSFNLINRFPSFKPYHSHSFEDLLEYQKNSLIKKLNFSFLSMKDDVHEINSPPNDIDSQDYDIKNCSLM